MTTSIDELYEWIEEERSCLWSHFVEASYRAIKTPDPSNRRHWSIEMEGIADRIQEANGLLGHGTNWREVGWASFPYWPLIEGGPLPEEAWDWVQQHVDRERSKGHVVSSAEHALEYRPVKA